MTNGDKVDPRLFRKKPTYTEILNLIEQDADKIELPERIGVQLFDSFAMGQYKEMLQESAAGTQAVAEHQQMDNAMTKSCIGSLSGGMSGSVRGGLTSISQAHTGIEKMTKIGII